MSNRAMYYTLFANEVYLGNALHVDQLAHQHYQTNRVTLYKAQRITLPTCTSVADSISYRV
jgi:hypothetical protein